MQFQGASRQYPAQKAQRIMLNGSRTCAQNVLAGLKRFVPQGCKTFKPLHVFCSQIAKSRAGDGGSLLCLPPTGVLCIHGLIQKISVSASSFSLRVDKLRKKIPSCQVLQKKPWTSVLSTNP